MNSIVHEKKLREGFVEFTRRSHSLLGQWDITPSNECKECRTIKRRERSDDDIRFDSWGAALDIVRR
jgi:hypothetical protein